ncbi:hypothetical protein F383_02019 [Gossypium arboreum]|uniref:Uncharacterized protein n=1 Tax=Gossypium arboreum TaxID=29729 RepID=A0A0B0NKB9_GOSAR|nr:hypothetical protein F383_02018 [Gossypium arboreum]KHG13103.1 hypothetical protein F383_02019 [Gossypium arboreum]
MADCFICYPTNNSTISTSLQPLPIQSLN